MHYRGRVGRDRARAIRNEQRATFGGQVFEALPLDPEPMLVDGVEGAPRQCAEVFAAAPTVDIRPAHLARGRRLRPSQGDELATDAGIDVGEVDVGSGRRDRRADFPGDLQPSFARPLGSVGHLGSLGGDRGLGRGSKLSHPRYSIRLMDTAPPLRFAELARRIGAAARAAGLVVPAFRTPPRRAGVARTIRRLPGGPVVAVRSRSRPTADVVADMVEGVVVANGLTADAARRVRESLLGAVVGPATVGPESAAA